MQFFIPEKLPSLNEVIRKNRTNRYAAATMKKQLEAQIMGYIQVNMRFGELRKVQKPCEITITWYESTKRRDVDNIQSSQKFILDALQKAGILENDNRRWVTQIHHHVADANFDGVQVVLKELEEMK